MKRNARPRLSGIGVFAAGGVCIVASIVLFTLRPVWALVNSALVFAGIALIAHFFFSNRAKLPAWPRAGICVNVFVMCILAFGIWGMVNYASYRRYGRLDWTATGKYRLEDFSKKLVGSLEHNLRLTTVFRPGALLREVRDLLDEYRAAGPAIMVSHLDPDREPGSVSFLSERLGIEQIPNESVILEYNDRFRVVRKIDMFTYDLESVKANPRERPVAQFRGEAALTSAIMELTGDKAPIVYFTSGHGEKDINAHSRGGLSLLRDALRRENCVVLQSPIDRVAARADSLDVVVCAGPTTPFFAHEAAFIREHLSRGGAFLLLMDPFRRCGLEDILLEYGVSVREDVVLDPFQRGSVRDPFALHIYGYGMHAITRNLVKYAIVLSSARSIVLQTAGDKHVETEGLLFTSNQSWGERNPRAMPLRFDEGEDTKGPLCVGAVVEERVSAYNVDGKKKGARIGIFGDSHFITNGSIGKQANEDLILNTFSWLNAREEMCGIRAKATDRRRMILSAAQKKAVFWVCIGAIPSLCLLAGTFVWWRRRA